MIERVATRLWYPEGGAPNRDRADFPPRSIGGVIGPKAAYLLGGVTGLMGTALLVPLLRLLPRRAAVAVDPSI